ncbi:MAG: succinate dehydrogenase, hydrophobic membrane anchor protein [Calditrichaeota bacterium]|nr:succinate dehydrogenase, hydrophobic membrane anchor protein [Calditrichota bacterium]
MAYKYKGSSTSGTFGWYFQRITGVILFIQVLVHFYISHRTWDSGHDWATIIQRLSDPYMKTFYLVFVALGLYHGLNGVWAIIRDYHMSDGRRKFIFGVIFTIGIFIGMLGFLTMLTLPSVQ